MRIQISDIRFKRHYFNRLSYILGTILDIYLISIYMRSTFISKSFFNRIFLNSCNVIKKAHASHLLIKKYMTNL
jgi:hypothetical protein